MTKKTNHAWLTPLGLTMDISGWILVIIAVLKAITAFNLPSEVAFPTAVACWFFALTLFALRRLLNLGVLIEQNSAS